MYTQASGELVALVHSHKALILVYFVGFRSNLQLTVLSQLIKDNSFLIYPVGNQLKQWNFVVFCPYLSKKTYMPYGNKVNYVT